MRTVVLGEPPPVVADWLERRRALGQDLWYANRSVEMVPVDGGRLLGLSAADLQARLDWPPAG